MDIEKIENVGNIAGIGLFAYILLRGGVLGALDNVANTIFSGKLAAILPIYHWLRITYQPADRQSH